MLEFLIDHHEHGPIGVTGLSELSVRDRRATVGSWVGRAHWGTGANAESKALVAALGFGTLGLERLTAWTNTRNGRSQRALERVGFRREGVLRNWHRHGDEMHDVVVFGMLRAAWAASPLRAMPAVVEGTPPASFVLGETRQS
jgi:ribosomal-protein-alanine N-acetyltransferase